MSVIVNPFASSALRKKIMRERLKKMANNKSKVTAAKKIQYKFIQFRDSEYDRGYKSLDYDKTYKKMFHCPVYFYEWKPNLRGEKSKFFMNGYNDKLKEIQNDIQGDLEDMIPQSTFPAQSRVVAIGDIHGDWRALTYSLTAAKVIDDNGKWIGGNTYVVQLGDCTDRYRALDNSNGELATKSNEKSEKRILNYLWDLDKQARKVKGRVITVIGNHEIMNTKGGMSYVTPLGRTNFNNSADNEPFALTTKVYKINKNALPNRYNLNTFNENENVYNDYPNNFRSEMWSPGSKYAKLYSKYPAICKIGKNLYMHGGLNSEIAKKADKIAQKMKKQKVVKMKGSLEYMNTYMWCYLNDRLNAKQLEIFNDIFGNHKDPKKKGILYYKLYSRSLMIKGKKVDPLCEDLDESLKIMKANRMIVAHVPQEHGIQTGCNHAVIKTNIAMSEAFGPRFNRIGRIPQVLNIQNGKYTRIFSKLEINNAYKNKNLHNNVKRNMNKIVNRKYINLLSEN